MKGTRDLYDLKYTFSNIKKFSQQLFQKAGGVKADSIMLIFNNVA